MRRSDVLKAMNQDKKQRVEDSFTPEEVEAAKEAMRIYHHEWYMAHKDAVNAYNRKRYADNRDAMREYRREWYNKHKDAAREYQQKCYREYNAFTRALQLLRRNRPPRSVSVRKGRFLVAKKADHEVLYELTHRLIDAETKHPRFADTPEEAMFVIFTECGEASQEVAKRGPCWEQNFEYELIDVMATCKRALLGDHKHIYGKSPDEQIKRW